jgi:putative SOS response-associated peptidase YedK
MRWGLVPSWAKDPTIGFRTINARSETVTTTPSFREPFKSQRCLIPADGFYEWVRNGKSKQPYCFEVGRFSHSLGYGTGGLIREEKWLRAYDFDNHPKCSLG